MVRVGVAGIAAAAVLAALFDSSGIGTPTNASVPDCYVAAQPTGGNPNAPTDLDADLPPFQFLGQTDIAWTDNSDNEACFVVERKFVDQEYELVAILPANTDEFRDEGPYDQGDWLFYRVYAATSTQRSFYSNEDDVDIPIVDPTPTPTPTGSPPIAGNLRGDLNCDGDVDPLDSMSLLRTDAGLALDLPSGCLPLDAEVDVDPTGVGFPVHQKGDLNCLDGMDPRDSLVVLRYDAGLDPGLVEDCWPLGTEVWPA